MSAPVTPGDLEPLVPSEQDDLCSAIEKANGFDLLMRKFVSWLLDKDGNLNSEEGGIVESICNVECTTTTSTTTTTTT